MSIRYSSSHPITANQLIDVFRRSTLSERRPVEDRDCMEGMVQNASLTVTAWEGEILVGVARSITDFHYACYLSDLAVDIAYQGMGIGTKLIGETQRALGPRCKIRLISAPVASTYYPKIGFIKNESCWELPFGGFDGDVSDIRKGGG